MRSRLHNLVGPSPVLHSWGYADAYLRHPDPRMPEPQANAHYAPGRGLWLPFLLAPVRQGFASNSCLAAASLDITYSGTAGRALIVCMSIFPTYPGPISCVDSTGANTYNADYNVNNTVNGRCAVYSCLNITGSPTYVRITFSSGSYVIATVIEVSGLQGGGVMDKSAGSDSAGPTTYTSGNTAAISQASEYLLGIQHKINQSATFTPDAPWTLVDRRVDGSYHVQHTQDQVVSSVAAYASTGSTNDTAFSSTIVTYPGVSAVAGLVAGQHLMTKSAVQRSLTN